MAQRRPDLVVSAAGLVAWTFVACATAGGPPVPARVLDEATAACAKLDAPEAALVGYRRLQSLRAEDEVERRQAEFAVGQALYCSGLYSEALATFDFNAPKLTSRPRRVGDPVDRALADASGKPSERITYAPTLRWLVFLHRRFPHWSGVDDAVAAYQQSSFDAPELADVRDDLLALAGRAAYQSGAFERSRALLGSVAPAAAPYARAMLFKGAAHVRDYQAAGAVDVFSRALQAAPAGVAPDVVHHRDLARISLARTYYSTGQFDLAIKFYGEIPPGSMYSVARSFESAWTEYMRGDHPAALRHIGAVRAAADAAAPVLAEATLLEATIRADDGERARAAAGVAAFTAVYPALFEDLKTWLAADVEDASLYARLAAMRAVVPRPAAGVERVVRQMLAERAVARRFEDVEQLTGELALYDRMPTAWRSSELGTDTFGNLTVRRARVVSEAAVTCRARINRVKDEIGRLIRGTIQVPYEM